MASATKPERSLFDDREREAKHTPGPWESHRIDTQDGHVEFCVKQKGAPPSIDAVAWTGLSQPPAAAGVIEANARLIAASPALLEALEELLEAEAEASWRPKGERGPIIKPARDKAKSAISLARKGGEA